jgi:hypothetical protein
LHRFTTLYLALLNKRHASERTRLGKSAVIVDRSMMNSQELTMDAQDNDGAGVVMEGGEKAFDDITDLKNEDFIFVY